MNARRLQSLALAALLTAAGAATAATANTAERRLVRRALTIADAAATTVSEIRVGGGISTTLVFQVPVKEKGILLSDRSGNFFPPQIVESSILLVPKNDVPAGKTRTLTVTLADGTVLPFTLVSDPREVDLQVDVAITASPDSPQALRASLTQLRSQLDECQSSAGTAGVSKIAALILSQDLGKPQAFTVERRGLSRIDKQSRLLVELNHAYRLFGQTYLVLSVQNRDPTKTWVLDRAELGWSGASPLERIRVLTYAAELPSLPPDETGKIVVVFDTPAPVVGHTLYLALHEKNGGRIFRFDDLSL